MGSYAKPMEGQKLLSFLSGARRRKKLFAQCIFGRDFLSPRTTIALGIETIPAPACLACSDDLALLLPRLAL